MKPVLATIIFMFITITGYSQAVVGAFAGINYSKLNGIGSIKDSYDWKRGLHFGFLLENSIGDQLWLKQEAIFIERGYVYNKKYSQDRVLSGDTLHLSSEAKIRYIDVPILVKLNLNRFYVELGPSLSFLVNGSSKDEYTLRRNGAEEKYLVNKNIGYRVEPVDIGFTAGVGYIFDSGLGINVRMNQGFRDALHRVNWQKNLIAQSSLSYTLGHKKKVQIEIDRGSSRYTKKKSSGANSTNSKAKAYRIVAKQNITRVSITKIGESEQPQVQYVFKSMGSNIPSNILMSGSSGVEEQNALFIGFRNIKFPFKGIIKYTVKASVGAGYVESNLEYEINQPGIWRITLTTQ